MIRSLFHRLFSSNATPVASVPGPTALVQVYERAGRCFIEPSDRTRWSEAGYWVSSGRVAVLDTTVGDDALGGAVLEALASSRVEVPVPPRGTKLEAGLFRAMGVRSRRAAMSGTRSCMVTREAPDGAIHVAPLRNGGTSGDGRGYSAIAGRTIALAAASAAPELGSAIRAALAIATA